MLKKVISKIADSVALGMVLNLSAAYRIPVMAAPANETSVSVQVKFEQGAYVDW